MRNFEERKAEVFRRSESRMKERKRNRNRFLALCIPLCLMLIVWSATVLPSILPGGHDVAEDKQIGNISYATADTARESSPGFVHSFVLVDVKGTGAQSQYHSVISDAPVVNDVFEQIYTILIPHESHNDIIGDLSDGTINIPASDGCGEIKDSESGYIITMTTANGVNRTFTLADNKLYDADLDMEMELTDEQIRGLKSALGLTN